MRFDLNWKIDLKPFKHWIALGALLVVTLGFDSTREAHTLCWRWLLHLNGNTTVQGMPDGYGFHFIPSVQFTPEYQRLLEKQSTNSLEGYFLAGATPSEFEPQPPSVKTAWTNSPLFPLMVFRMARRALVTNDDAESLSPAGMNSVRTMVRLARLYDPGNGAYSQAEACFDFAVHDNESAIQALWTSSSNRNWTCGLAITFAGQTDLFEHAGLSKLDAAFQAGRLGPNEGSYLASCNQRFLDGLMIQSVQDGKPGEFARLFDLLVELRRPDWTGKCPQISNDYRDFKPSNQLVEAMALPLNISLATNWTDLPYEKYKLIRQQVFQGYLSRYADPVAMAVFNSQSESFQTENRLKIQAFENDFQNTMELIFFIGTEVAGGTCLWLVALLCSTLLFSCLHWRQSHLVRAGKPWWRDSALWLLVLVTLCLCTVISASFFQVIRFAGFDEAPAPDSWLMILMVILSLSILLSFMLKKWPRAKVQWNSWKTFQGFAVVYLVAILAMAFFRTQMVAYLVAMYQ